MDYSLFAFPKPQKDTKKQKRKDVSKRTREEIKKLFKGKCALCGRDGTEIHHIRYRSEDKAKIDDIDNLILLCLEHHRLVHTNKKYWQPILLKLRGEFKFK